MNNGKVIFLSPRAVMSRIFQEIRVSDSAWF